ncbi:MAG: histidine kinase [Verrucomicrobia bacterium]|nr:histidine kinase [Verrucomicrobiota bacterium]
MPIISHPQVRTTGEAVNGATYPPPRPEQAVSLAASLVEDSDDAIVGKTLDGRVFSWNGGAERLFGYRATEIKRLQSLVLETAERVQRRIGQDLHDGLSQQLSGIAYLAHVLLRKLESHARPEAEEAGRIVELISEATEQARAVARGLLPVKPEPQGLVEALRGLARSVERTYPLTCWFFGDADLGLPDPTPRHPPVPDRAGSRA